MSIKTRRLLLLLLAALAMKSVVLLQLYDHPMLQPDIGLDTTAYADLAKRVVNGDLGLGPGLYYVSPLYIYFLAAGLALTDSFTAVRALQLLLGVAAVGGVFGDEVWRYALVASVALPLGVFLGRLTRHRMSDLTFSRLSMALLGGTSAVAVIGAVRNML